MNAKDKLAYRVGEFADAIGVSRSKGYELVATGEIPSIRVGGCVRIPVAAAQAHIKKLLASQKKSR